ncbi:unnamed protein product [Enterobius vermicularis]|uniref:Replication termination factor 2 n=1 Tax=Enterobius vermicularis TaxID=51028 RepID=A0A0N4V9B8_ENTVE|nr:unnamed protein product [Enterobius vermicularis]
MGADGGTIPKRCELVKSKKKAEKVEKSVKNASRWRLCRLSQQPLRRPIVACRLGGLYNKEAVIDAILTKKIAENENSKHIRGLRDVKELKLVDSKDYSEGAADKSDVYKDHNLAPFCCPVTGLPMNGNHVFVVNWLCGCVVSEKAINEVKSTVCVCCGGPFSSDDLIVLNPESELLQKYEAKLEEERQKSSFQCGLSSACFKGQEGDDHHSKSLEKKTAEPKTLKRKNEASHPTSIQDDKNASAAYKSLFTTCEEAKKRPKAHWVTYNPLFY